MNYTKKNGTRRFWARVGPEPTTGCWLWSGTALSNGYGVIALGPRTASRPVYVHRYMWIAQHGSIPTGFCVLHKCDTRLCCNPEHLFLGTRKDNTADMIRKNRQSQSAKHGRIPDSVFAEARVLVAEGCTLTSIARRLGVSIGHLSTVLRGLSRAGLPPSARQGSAE